LSKLNYHLGAIDGQFGSITRAAVLAFQANQGLPTTGVVDAATKAALMTAGPRPISQERAFETIGDLREKGSEIIGMSDWLQRLGISTGVLGAIGISQGQFELISRIFDGITGVSTPALTQAAAAAPPDIEPIAGIPGQLISLAGLLIGTPTGIGAIAVVGGALFLRNARRIKLRRLIEHRKAGNLDR
jgi:peptidoglycan hydrolase-like protein with peptidoglycan-binding domain